MRAGTPFGTPRLDELAVGVEDEHRIGRSVLMVDKDSPLRIFLHHVGGPEAHTLGHFSPAMQGFVSVTAMAQNRSFATDCFYERAAGNMWRLLRFFHLVCFFVGVVRTSIDYHI